MSVGRYVLRVTLAICVGLLAVGCSNAGREETVAGDYPTYATVADLAEQADVVVQGHVVQEVARQIESSGAERNDEGELIGNPMVFYRFSVTRQLQGEPVGEAFLLGWIDLELLKLENVSPLARGSEVLLFLEHISDSESPNIDVVDDFYIPVSADNGVFDVRDGTAVARSREVRGLQRIESSAGGEPWSSGVDQISAVVQANSPAR